jgi:hypothetical protein
MTRQAKIHHRKCVLSPRRTWSPHGALLARKPPRRAERAAMLKDAGAVDDTLLGELVKRYGL